MIIISYSCRTVNFLGDCTVVTGIQVVIAEVDVTVVRDVAIPDVYIKVDELHGAVNGIFMLGTEVIGTVHVVTGGKHGAIERIHEATEGVHVVAVRELEICEPLPGVQAEMERVHEADVEKVVLQFVLVETICVTLSGLHLTVEATAEVVVLTADVQKVTEPTVQTETKFVSAFFARENLEAATVLTSSKEQ